jgi:hypothetical protein
MKILSDFRYYIVTILFNCIMFSNKIYAIHSPHLATSYPGHFASHSAKMGIFAENLRMGIFTIFAEWEAKCPGYEVAHLADFLSLTYLTTDEFYVLMNNSFYGTSVTNIDNLSLANFSMGEDGFSRSSISFFLLCAKRHSSRKRSHSSM